MTKREKPYKAPKVYFNIVKKVERPADYVPFRRKLSDPIPLWLDQDPDAWSWRVELGVLGAPKTYQHPITIFWNSDRKDLRDRALHVIREVLVRCEGQLRIMSALLDWDKISLYRFMKRVDKETTGSGEMKLMPHANRLRIKYGHTSPTGVGRPRQAGSRRDLTVARKSLARAFREP